MVPLHCRILIQICMLAPRRSSRAFSVSRSDCQDICSAEAHTIHKKMDVQNSPFFRQLMQPNRRPSSDEKDNDYPICYESLDNGTQDLILRWRVWYDIPSRMHEDVAEGQGSGTEGMPHVP
jgi:hypothetical protein